MKTDFLYQIADQIGRNRYLNAIRDAFLLAFPLTFFGSIFVVLANLPFLEAWWSPEFLGAFRVFLGPSFEGTLAVVSFFVAFGIGYYLTTSYKLQGVFGGILSLCTFLIMVPFVTTPSALNPQEIMVSIDIARLGARGLFVAIFGGILTVEIYRFLQSRRFLVITMPESVPPAVANAFNVLLPVFFTLTFFVILSGLFSFTVWGNIQDAIYSLLQEPLLNLGSGIVPTLIAVFFIQVFWFLGLHGQTLVTSMLDPVWTTLGQMNLEAYNAGEPLVYPITKSFIDTFTVGMGGSGMTLIVVLLLIFSKKEGLRSVGKVALPSGIFNVNEPVIFGLPIVMNFLLFIPWIVAPLVVVLVNYLLMVSGLFPYPTGVAVPWTTPIIINGILATSSLMGGLMQIIDVAIVAVIWMPFLRFYARRF